MAQTMAEYLIEQGEERGKAQAKREAVLKLLWIHSLRRFWLSKPFQGVQYLSKAYITTLEEHGVEISVAHRGRPWENGYAERLIRTLKEEEVDINDYQSIAEARDRIGHFIEQMYHQKRPIRR